MASPVNNLRLGKLIRRLGAAAALGSLCGICSAQATAPAVNAKAAILVDCATGQVLYEKDADRRLPPASTTKIMTSILLLENTRPDDIIVADEKTALTEETSIHLKAGERISAHDILYALLLRSANDACVAVGHHVGGSDAKFVEMMNAKAREIGAGNTTFNNPNGLPDPKHLTTARDLARIARYATQYPDFNAATRTKTYLMNSRTYKDDLRLRSKTRLLWAYDGADGVKTGWTTQAGNCLVGSATRGGWRLLTVLLNCPDTTGETARLLNYGFGNFHRVPVIAGSQRVGQATVTGGATRGVQAIAQQEVQIVVANHAAPRPTVQMKLRQLKAPVRVGAAVGVAEVSLNGRVVASTPLLAAASVEIAKGSGLLWGVIRVFLAALMIVGVIYGSAASKAARIRRYRIQAKMRVDRGLG
ncbi:MAG: D-alanyl-D-alanine carboxypeptidase [Armatimonadetes bacterium]|nr:D-alanyl-D-alanine carboxypeptidase [Armatimonadota bacterium]